MLLNSLTNVILIREELLHGVFMTVISNKEQEGKERQKNCKKLIGSYSL